MESFLAFLQENYRLLIECFLLLLTLIVLLVKKQKVNILSESSILDALIELPSIISKAEKLYGKGNGKDKFVFVFNEVIKIIVSSSGLSTSSVVDMYGETLSKQIEKILETPQKKD